MKNRVWVGAVLAAAVITGVLAQDVPPPPGTDLPPTSGPVTPEGNSIEEVDHLSPKAKDYLEKHERLLKELTDKKVMAAIRTGADALLKQITEDSKGDPRAGAAKVLECENLVLEVSKDGVLPLSVYALLVTGRALDDDRLAPTSKAMAKPIQLMMEMKSTYTYSLAAQANAMALLPAKPELQTALVNVRNKLTMNMHKDGAFGYAGPTVNFGDLGLDWRDNSNSQFALLGMWACDEAGAAVPESFWKMSDQLWRTRQAANGGWGYYCFSQKPGKGELGLMATSQTMTAAGLASLYVTSSRLNRQVKLDSKPDPAIEAALANLSRNFDLLRVYMGANPYFAYAIERVGRASGRKYLGKLDWFREGAAELVAAQEKGFWRDAADAYPYGGTSFALLFLTRGSSPVAFNKLQYAGSWDARPQDVGNLTRAIEKKSERLLNWEIVDIDARAGADWADAPILVITGHGDPKFSDAQIAKLKNFIQSGGIIFSTADGNDAAFTDAIKTKYAPQMAEKRYEMRLLPKEHPFYTLDVKSGRTRETPLWAMSNGSRELWVHCPKDLGAAWQSQVETQKESWDLPANMVTYASGRVGLRRRMESLSVEDPEVAPTKNAAIARVRYQGNFDPEPGAWPRFIRVAALEHDMKLEVVTTDVDALDPRKTPLSHMTGTDAIKLTDGQRAKLGAYLNGGGFLIADATGGGEAFSQSLQAELAKAVNDVKFLPVELEKHPVTTGSMAGGVPMKDLELRRFCLTPENLSRKLKVQEIWVGGKVVGIQFEGDVTSGLMGTNTWGILGYSATCSQGLMWNAMRFGMDRK